MYESRGLMGVGGAEIIFLGYAFKLGVGKKFLVTVGAALLSTV